MLASGRTSPFSQFRIGIGSNALPAFGVALCVLFACLQFNKGKNATSKPAVTGRTKSVYTPQKSAGCIKKYLSWVTAGIVLLTVTITAAGLIIPALPVDSATLHLAETILIKPDQRQDFEVLERLPIWKGQKLRTLLTHLELSSYVIRELVNWTVDEELYQDFVLSPSINDDNRGMDWRRELWENFYPRVRHENTTTDAAAIVVRFLRQRVTIAPAYPKQQGVESMWADHVVNAADFEVLYVAALRSAGIPARLNQSSMAEFWTGSEWKTAPRSLSITWMEA